MKQIEPKVSSWESLAFHSGTKQENLKNMHHIKIKLYLCKVGEH